MPDTLIDIRTGPLPETVFKKEEQKVKNNPYYGILTEGYVDYLKHKIAQESTEKYLTTKRLMQFKESLPNNAFKEGVEIDVLNRNLAEKLFIADFIEKGYILPERPSQDLYFRFNLKTGETSHLDEENGPRIDILIWWAHYFKWQRKTLREQGVNMGYIKISIKKNPPDNELSIESINIVERKDS